MASPFLTIVSCGQMISLSSDGTKTVTWTANREAAVNKAGGGYRVYHSPNSGFDPASAAYVDVPFSGATTPTSVELSSLLEVTTYVRVAAFGKDATGSTNFGAASAQISFEPTTGSKNLILKSQSRFQTSGSTPDATLKVTPESTQPQSRIPATLNDEKISRNGLALGKVAIAPEHKLVRFGHDHYLQNEILITYRSGATLAARQNTRRQMGALQSEKLLAESLVANPIERVKIASVMSVQSAIEAALLDPNVERAQPNFIYHKYATPNDPNFSKQWDLKNTGQTVTTLGADAAVVDSSNPGTAGADMNIESAWDINTDCTSHVVAVIDSGVNYSHTDLTSNMWTGVANGSKDFVNVSTGTGKGMEGHGTHVAGTIGAVGNNGTGMAGVCWKAQIMNVRVLDNDGSGTTAAVVQGIDYARTNGAKIINMSLGGSGYDATLDTAVRAASDAGIVLAVAAGNDGSNNDSSPDYPCSFPYSGVICVAALDQVNGLADYSNYGKTSVDVAAPGTNITNLWNGTVTEVPVAPSDFSNLSAGGWNSGVHPNYGLPMASIPAAWDGTSAKYAANTTSYMYYSTAFPTADYLSFNFFTRYSIAVGDSIAFNLKPGSGNPFSSGTAVASFTDSSTSDYEHHSMDISACSGIVCSFGLQLNSASGSATSYGMWIIQLSYTGLALNNTSFDTISGTSMATPHVAGLAALIWGVNPGYTAKDVILAINSSGKSLTSLSGKTVTGKGVDAAAAVRFIAPATGLVSSN